jgi:hypothetical protein
MLVPRSLHPLFCLTLICLIFGLMPLPQTANAAESLSQPIKKADAKYLAAKTLLPTDSAPKIETGLEEDEQGTPPTREIAQGNVKAVLSYKEDKNEEGEIVRTPIVTVSVDGKEVAKLERDDLGLANPPVSVQIAELDSSNRSPEVVAAFFTGGAHCCSDTKVITASPDGSSWKTVDVGEFDGGPLTAVDLDGDGRYEFETRDNAFLYTFGCYACSVAPLEILAVENGAVKNVTREPRFRPAHESYLKDIITGAPDDDVNGFLAGYVAEKILLGEGKEAWALMLTHYDRSSDWGLDLCDRPLNEAGECLDKAQRLTFPDALERMLKENGYNVE